jgi:hypothetical protein
LGAQWDEANGKILLGDNTGGKAVMRRPIRFHCVGIWISYAVDHMYVFDTLISDLRRIFSTVGTAGSVCVRHLLWRHIRTCRLRGLLTYILTYLPTYLLTYLLTHSMEQSPSWEANQLCLDYGLED